MKRIVAAPLMAGALVAAAPTIADAQAQTTPIDEPVEEVSEAADDDDDGGNVGLWGLLGLLGLGGLLGLKRRDVVDTTYAAPTYDAGATGVREP